MVALTADSVAVDVETVAEAGAGPEEGGRTMRRSGCLAPSWDASYSRSVQPPSLSPLCGLARSVIAEIIPSYLLSHQHVISRGGGGLARSGQVSGCIQVWQSQVQ